MENKTEVTSSDYKGSALEKSFFSDKITIEEKLQSNFEKGLIDEETFDKACIELDLLKAGKRGVIGEVRERKGGKYRKTAQGWEKVVKTALRDKKLATVDHSKIASDLIDKFHEGKGANIWKEVQEYEIHGKNSDLDSIIKKLGLKDGDKNKIADFIKKHDEVKGSPRTKSNKDLGKTKSGKTINLGMNASAESKYTSKDHEDAAYAHLDHAKKLIEEGKEDQAQTHNAEFDRHMGTKVHKKQNEDLDKEDVK